MMTEQSPRERLAEAVKEYERCEDLPSAPAGQWYDAMREMGLAARALLAAPDDAESDNNLPPDYDWIRAEMPRHVDWVKTHEWKHPDGRTIYCPTRTWKPGVQMCKGGRMPSAATRGQVRRFIATGLLPCEVPPTAPDDAAVKLNNMEAVAESRGIALKAAGAELRAVKALASTKGVSILEYNDSICRVAQSIERIGCDLLGAVCSTTEIERHSAPTAVALCAKLGIEVRP